MEPTQTDRARLHPLGELIFYDRYAAKMQDRSTLQRDELVVVCLDPNTGQRELAKVAAAPPEGDVTVAFPDGAEVTVPRDHVDRPTETFADAKTRIARAIAQAESPEQRTTWSERFRALLGDGDSIPPFVPAGRIWAGAGLQERLTPYNCVSGDTIVHTDRGPVRIDTLAGETVQVLSQGGVYRPATFASYGQQQLFEVRLSNGDTLRATAEHEWLASKNGGNLRVVTTLGLEGLEIPFNPSAELFDPLGEEFLTGLRHGITFGDGTITSARKARVQLFGAKRELAAHFGAFTVSEQPDHTLVTGVPAEWKSLPPDTALASYWRGFILGMVATDGCVDENGSVMVTQTPPEVLEAIQRNAPKAGLIALPTRVLRKRSPYGEQYAPCLVTRLVRSFLKPEDLVRSDQRQAFVAAGPSKRKRRATVVSVKATSVVEEVYCCVEEETHTMTIGRGYLTKQCFVLPAPRDSRHGIVETLDRMLEIMSRGGGVGIPLMTLRPQYARVVGVNGRSSGATLWSQLYSFGTGLIEQGGSRRGALMLIQYVWHPDVLSFLAAKQKPGVLENANLSIAITDDFMAAVAADGPWELVFPDTTHAEYDALWDGDIAGWRARGLPVKVHATIQARDLWDKVVESAWRSAEPGLFFVDRYNALSNSYYYADGRIWCTNPCGEQGLPPWGVCNLGHLNLAAFLDGDGLAEPARLDWTCLRNAIHLAVRFQDDLIDVAFTPFAENDTQQKAERRIGLGTMGLGELLIRMHIPYGGNAECLAFLDRLYGFIATEAYMASTDLAAEKGAFPRFHADRLLASGFAKTLPEHVRAAIREKGLRNVTLLTQAPTGTVGTMMNTSTGIEPFYAYQWERFGRLGTHAERVGVYAEYLAAHPEVAAARDRSADAEAVALVVSASLSDKEVAERRAEARNRYLALSSEHLPPWFANSYTLAPEDHARTQAAIQRWTDSSISKTSNLPSSYTPAQVGAYYELLYKLGAKGGTVYRDGSRSVQVLTAGGAPAAAPPPPEPPMELLKVPSGDYDLRARSVQTPLGKLSVKLGIHPDTGEFFEAWLDLSKGGTDVSAFTEALARAVSVCLRIPSPMTPLRRLQLLALQFEGIGGSDPWGYGAARVLSVPDGVSKAFRGLTESRTERSTDAPATPPPPDAIAPRRGADVCPTCHQATLMRIEGCAKCPCGFSKC